ncbi:hypothetical protein F5887DRAFT_1281090 [Amanita rubescens]|nr:hypothetical protein F5887DRAFT_1281090 [Amanita rubescens]
MLSCAKGYIVGITMQAIVTGAYFVSFLLCLRWLVFSDDGESLRKRISWPFLIITIILFAISMTGFAISLQVGQPWVSEGCTVDYPPVIVDALIETSTPMITDGVLIVAHHHTSPPSIGIQLIKSSRNGSGLAHLRRRLNWPWLQYGRVVLCLYNRHKHICNIKIEAAIILKIWRNSLSRRFSLFAIRVIAESGLLYTLTSIAVLFAMLFGTKLMFAVTNAISFPASLIAYNLILIRVGINRANPELELPTFIGDSTIERAVPAVPSHQSETVTS